MALMNRTTRKHYDKYERLRTSLGIRFNEQSPRFFDRTLEQVHNAYRLDPHLNNIPLEMWDSWWFSTLVSKRGLSMAEGVCIGKHCMIYDVLGAMPEFTD